MILELVVLGYFFIVCLLLLICVYFFLFLQVYKVLFNDVEVLKFFLMGLFEKWCVRKFFIFVQNYDEVDVKIYDGMNLQIVIMKELFEYIILFNIDFFFILILWIIIFESFVFLQEVVENSNSWMVCGVVIWKNCE